MLSRLRKYSANNSLIFFLNPRKLGLTFHANFPKERELALVDPYNACPSSDQEVAGSIPARSSNILSSRRVDVSFWQKNAHKYWLTA